MTDVEIFYTSIGNSVVSRTKRYEKKIMAERAIDGIFFDGYVRLVDGDSAEYIPMRQIKRICMSKANLDRHADED